MVCAKRYYDENSLNGIRDDCFSQWWAYFYGGAYGLSKVAELFIQKIRQDYALVVVMGSYIYGATHDRSDLDLYFVPKTERGYHLGFTFILEEIGFDLWPISWKRLEKIAGHEERITSIVTEGKVLFYSSQGDLDHFLELKSVALDTSRTSDFVKKSEEVFRSSYELIYLIQKAETISELRQYGIRFMKDLGYALSLLNCNTVKRGRGRLKEELLGNPLVPENFASCYDTLFLSHDMEAIKKDLLCLLKSSEKLIHLEVDKYREKGSAKDVLSGFTKSSSRATTKSFTPLKSTTYTLHSLKPANCSMRLTASFNIQIFLGLLCLICPEPMTRMIWVHWFYGPRSTKRPLKTSCRKMRSRSEGFAI